MTGYDDHEAFQTLYIIDIYRFCSDFLTSSQPSDQESYVHSSQHLGPTNQFDTAPDRHKSIQIITNKFSKAEHDARKSVIRYSKETDPAVKNENEKYSKLLFIYKISADKPSIS